MPPPYSVVSLEDTDSTQDDARAAFVTEPVLVVAGAQRRGRGRLASEWQTAPRAMAASLAVRPAWAPADLPLIPVLAGLAAARVLGCGLKWPNDVFVDDRKVGGILVEASDGVVVVGFGLNLWWPSPPVGVGAVHNDDPGPDRRFEVAEAWTRELLELIEAGPRSWPRHEYREVSITIGRDITWSPDGAGRAVDIAADGGLVVVTPHGPTTLHASAVRHVR
jgi:BirA family transcriptional regulator, biotin operon repressor / biotin---[acetyl-CoA-carboxylase] ligase